MDVRISSKFDMKPQRFQIIGRHLTSLEFDEGINVSMAKEDWSSMVWRTFRDQAFRFLIHGEITGQAEDSGQFDGRGDSREDGNGATLREAADDNPIGWDALIARLLLD